MALGRIAGSSPRRKRRGGDQSCYARRVIYLTIHYFNIIFIITAMTIHIIIIGIP
jgi:hypothetical protein